MEPIAVPLASPMNTSTTLSVYRLVANGRNRNDRPAISAEARQPTCAPSCPIRTRREG